MEAQACQFWGTAHSYTIMTSSLWNALDKRLCWCHLTVFAFKDNIYFYCIVGALLFSWPSSLPNQGFFFNPLRSLVFSSSSSSSCHGSTVSLSRLFCNGMSRPLSGANVLFLRFLRTNFVWALLFFRFWPLQAPGQVGLSYTLTLFSYSSQCVFINLHFVWFEYTLLRYGSHSLKAIKASQELLQVKTCSVTSPQQEVFKVLITSLTTEEKHTQT